jgi:hypothetical protein
VHTYGLLVVERTAKKEMHGSRDDLEQDGALWRNLHQVLKKHATGY